MDLASATTKGKRVLVASIVLSLHMLHSLFLCLFSHMHALILFVCPLCYITGTSTTVASTAVGARRTWTSLRLLLFSEPRRPLKFGRKPFATRSSAVVSSRVLQAAAFLRKQLQLQLRSRRKCDETALGVFCQWGVDALDEALCRTTSAPSLETVIDAIEASNNTFSAKEGCNNGLHARPPPVTLI